jgi:ABC-type amino acid transport substrate-binding protein
MVIPLAYPMPRGEQDLAKYVNTWVQLRKKDGTVDRVFDLWILGKAAAKEEPRWSVIRDVLNWVD